MLLGLLQEYNPVERYLSPKARQPAAMGLAYSSLYHLQIKVFKMFLEILWLTDGWIFGFGPASRERYKFEPLPLLLILPQYWPMETGQYKERNTIYCLKTKPTGQICEILFSVSWKG